MPHGVPELLPEELLRRYELPLREEAIARVHFPEDDAPLDLYNTFRSAPQKRLIFEELFLFFLALELRRRADAKLTKPRAFTVDDKVREIVRKILPFRLTGLSRIVASRFAFGKAW